MPHRRPEPAMVAPRFDWLLLISGIVYVLAIHVETKLKTAKFLMDFDAHLAPNWYFGGLLRDGLQIFSVLGGILGAALLAYDWFYLAGWWSVAIFLGALYLKYAIAARRGLNSAMRALPAGWKSPVT
jgi:hypothetical protein